MRSFDLVANTISIQFQYAADSITASRRIFMKPPKPDYECEIIYEPELTRSYNVGKSKNHKYCSRYSNYPTNILRFAHASAIRPTLSSARSTSTCCCSA